MKSTRKKPPVTRTGSTYKIDIDGVTVYVTVNFDETGHPIELFAKASDGHQGWVDIMCLTASLAIQHGCPLETILAKWRWARFPPSQLGIGTSIPDAIARLLMAEIYRQDNEKQDEPPQTAQLA